MKKPVVLILSIVVVAVLGWFAVKLVQGKGSSGQTEYIDFAIKDIGSVDRVVITDPFGIEFEIRKNGEEWTDKDGGCIIQENAEFIIDALKNIELKGYLKDNSINNMIEEMSVRHIKVDIYQNGEWTKTWFIGPSTPDHYGQIMLLETAEYGKSDVPVEMKIKGVHGIIEPRFYADPRKWRCTNIFSLHLDEISKIDMKFNDEPQRSFTVARDGSNFNVFQQGKLLPQTDTAMIFRYLHNYSKVHFEMPNYVLDERQVDSIKHTVPFGILTVTETSGKKSALKMFRIQSKAPEEAGMGMVIDTDRDRFWCELPSGELVKCQYFHFGPLIFGHVFFPMDLSEVKTHDGILPK